jgi:hypothetical protein
MPRKARALAVAAAGLAAGALLTSCSKPVPKITVLGADKVATITPSTYCFTPTHCRKSTLELPVFTVASDDKVMIDVPQQVVHRGWTVNALSLNGSKVLGNSGVISGVHSYRVSSSANNGNPFIVEVDQLRHGTPDGSRWSFLVQVSPTKS